eukprot:GILI01014482.1.p1 GENE.GILI01014482.1~~GILI01014482.1.p1  ORF type:complete len:801 (+),score=87.05 GILI01014482.1:118-2403(+)
MGALVRDTLPPLTSISRLGPPSSHASSSSHAFSSSISPSSMLSASPQSSAAAPMPLELSLEDRLLWVRMLTRFREHLPPPTDIVAHCIALYGLSFLRPLGYDDGDLAELLVARLTSQVPHFQPQDFANSLTACARLGILNPSFLSAICAELCARMIPVSSSARAAPTASDMHPESSKPGLIEVNLKPLPAFSPSPSLSPRAAAFSSQALSNILWSLGVLEYRDIRTVASLCQELQARLSAQALQMPPTLHAPPQPNPTTASSALTPSGPPVVASAARRRLVELNSSGQYQLFFSPVGLSLLLFSLGHLRVRVPVVVELLWSQLQKGLGSLTGHELVNALHGLDLLAIANRQQISTVLQHLGHPSRLLSLDQWDLHRLFSALHSLSSSTSTPLDLSPLFPSLSTALSSVSDPTIVCELLTHISHLRLYLPTSLSSLASRLLIQLRSSTSSQPPSFAQMCAVLRSLAWLGVYSEQLFVTCASILLDQAVQSLPNKEEPLTNLAWAFCVAGAFPTMIWTRLWPLLLQIPPSTVQKSSHLSRALPLISLSLHLHAPHLFQEGFLAPAPAWLMSLQNASPYLTLSMLNVSNLHCESHQLSEAEIEAFANNRKAFERNPLRSQVLCALQDLHLPFVVVQAPHYSMSGPEVVAEIAVDANRNQVLKFAVEIGVQSRYRVSPNEGKSTSDDVHVPTALRSVRLGHIVFHQRLLKSTNWAVLSIAFDEWPHEKSDQLLLLSRKIQALLNAYRRSQAHSARKNSVDSFFTQ